MEECYIDIQVGKYEDGYGGLLYRNKPTPSGCTRYILWLSDNRRFETEEKALHAFKEIKTIQNIIKEHGYAK